MLSMTFSAEVMLINSNIEGGSSKLVPNVKF